MDGTTSNDELGTTGPSQGDRIDCPYSPSNRPTRKKNSSTTIVDGSILFDKRFTEAEADRINASMGFRAPGCCTRPWPVQYEYSF
jgi:hypothetical protein